MFLLLSFFFVIFENRFLCVILAVPELSLKEVAEHSPHGLPVCRELETMLSALRFSVIAQDISGAKHRASGKDIN